MAKKKTTKTYTVFYTIDGVIGLATGLDHSNTKVFEQDRNTMSAAGFKLCGSVFTREGKLSLAELSSMLLRSEAEKLFYAGDCNVHPSFFTENLTMYESLATEKREKLLQRRQQRQAEIREEQKALREERVRNAHEVALGIYPGIFIEHREWQDGTPIIDLRRTLFLLTRQESGELFIRPFQKEKLNPLKEAWPVAEEQLRKAFEIDHLSFKVGYKEILDFLTEISAASTLTLPDLQQELKNIGVEAELVEAAGWNVYNGANFLQLQHQTTGQVFSATANEESGKYIFDKADKLIGEKAEETVKLLPAIFREEFAEPASGQLTVEFDTEWRRYLEHLSALEGIVASVGDFAICRLGDELTIEKDI